MKRLALLLLLLPALFLWGCSDDDDDGGSPVSPEDQAAANEAANDAMADMVLDMEAIVGEELDPEDLDAMMEMDMGPYAEGFADALALDPDCGPAHFGLAFVGMMRMAQDDELADLVDEFAIEFGEVDLPLGMPVAGMSTGALLEGGILGRSFEILRRAPLTLAPQELRLAEPGSDKADGPLIRGLQAYIHDTMLPATGSIVSHLSAAEADPDFAIVFTLGETDPETVDIDLGEVYVLDAVMRALRAGLRLATAYDVEIAPDGDYSWLLDNVGDLGYTSAEVVPGTVLGDTLYLFDDEEVRAQREAEIYAGLEGLLAPGTDFLTLWTDPWSGEDAMESAYNEIDKLLGKLEAAYAFIADETDDQSDDIISQMLIAELDAAIASMGENLPEHMGTWETIPDVIDWIDGFLSGPYTFPVDIGEAEPFELVVDVSALFLEPVDDWKTKLPYMTWLPFAEWAQYYDTYVWGPYGHDPDFPFLTEVMGEQASYDGIVAWYEVEDEWDFDQPFAFLDGPDGEVIEPGDFPYFPDYTLGGLFPGMDRADWLQLMGWD